MGKCQPAKCNSNFKSCTANQNICPVEAAGCCTNADCPAPPSGLAAKCDLANHTCSTECAANFKICGASCIPLAMCCSATTDCGVPTIVSLSPADGATGVKSDAVIVIRFSEKVDHASVQKAYSSGELPLAASTWTWQTTAPGETLSITPSTPLIYGNGGAKSYSFSLSEAATDLAGNALAATSWSFSTLRHYVVTLKPDWTLSGTMTDAHLFEGGQEFTATAGVLNVGNRAREGQLKTLDTAAITFMLTNAVPAGGQFESAVFRVYQNVVHGNPYSGGVQMGVYKMSFSKLAWSSFPGYDTLGTISTTGTLGWKPFDVTNTISQWLSTSEPRAQFGVDLPAPDNVFNEQYVEIGGTLRPNPPELNLTVLGP